MFLRLCEIGELSKAALQGRTSGNVGRVALAPTPQPHRKPPSHPWPTIFYRPYILTYLYGVRTPPCWWLEVLRVENSCKIKFGVRPDELLRDPLLVRLSGRLGLVECIVVGEAPKLRRHGREVQHAQASLGNDAYFGPSAVRDVDLAAAGARVVVEGGSMVCPPPACTPAAFHIVQVYKQSTDAIASGDGCAGNAVPCARAIRPEVVALRWTPSQVATHCISMSVKAPSR